MPKTPIFTKNLELLLEADMLAEAPGSGCPQYTDLSGKNRHLTASAPLPTITDAGGKKSVNWNGAQNPLKWTGNLTVRCGFLVVKLNNDFDNYNGVFTSPENFGIIVGNHFTQGFFDFGYDYYEFRADDRIYNPERAAQPKNQHILIFFRFWTNITLDGVQLGQDRNFTNRKLNGSIAFMALYSGGFDCEREIRQQTESIAISYRIPIENVYPYQGTKGDSKKLSKIVLSDGQSVPISRVRRGRKKFFDFSYGKRARTETDYFEKFWDAHYPGKSFVVRDYDYIPPRDTTVEINVPSEPEIALSGALPNRFNYSFQGVESGAIPLLAIPAVQPPGLGIDALPPSVPQNFAAAALSSSLVRLTWSASTDNIATSGYKVWRDGFVIDAGNTLEFYIGSLPAGTHTFKVLAYDGAGNESLYSATQSVVLDSAVADVTGLSTGTEHYSDA
ncbi:MAG TPA: fibronectin type III domain-containing protein, partial [Pyrinomonadaceae bacterium]|nr:fibronectin type III domain-containing protein [Pyrinomonadaceae bacterium]